MKKPMYKLTIISDSQEAEVTNQINLDEVYF